MRGEQSERVTGIHHKCLLVGHLAQVFHYKPILRPVLEHGAVSAIGYQFVRMLCYSLIEVVLNHHHDGCGLLRAVWILVNRTGVHLVGRPETIHVYSSICFQFLGKLGSQNGVKLLREVAQSVAKCKPLFLFGKNILAFRRMVDGRVVGLRLRQCVGNTGTNIFYELFFGHSWITFLIQRFSISLLLPN